MANLYLSESDMSPFEGKMWLSRSQTSLLRKPLVNGDSHILYEVTLLSKNAKYLDRGVETFMRIVTIG